MIKLSCPSFLSVRRAASPAAAPWFCAVLSLFLAAGCSPQKDIGDGVQLVLTGGDLGPTTTFELRFDEVAAGPAEVSTVAATSPLVIAPSIHGEFKWLSQRSGVFTPDEPLALNTGYRLTLRPGLRQPDGQPLHARLRQMLRTPSFKVSATPRDASPDASAEPEIKLLFNAPVKAAAARTHAIFRNAEGRSVPAEVWQGTAGERPPRYQFEGRVWRTWRDEFFASRQRSGAPSARFDEDSTSDTNEVSNFLIAVPQQPLPIGKGWKFVLSPGLPADEDSLRLPAKFEVPIGDVLPFTVGDVTVHNNINHPKEIRVRLSKPLWPGLNTNNTLRDWVSVSPEPENFEVRPAWRMITLRGDFKLNTKYLLTLRAGLPARDGFKLEETNQWEVIVPPVAPRLYFPAFAEDQLAGGSRQFPLLAMNVEKVRVRAKLLDAPTVIHALRGYRTYFRNWDERPDNEEPYKGVDYDLVPGRTIYSEELTGSKKTDVAEKILLAWDRLLAGRKAGAVFISADRINPGGENKPRLGTQSLMQLTDLGLIWKSSRDQICAFVFSHTTGRPVPQAAVRLYSDENEPLTEAVTDVTGLARLPAPTNTVWIMAQLGDDIHALRLNDHGMPLHAFDLYPDHSENLGQDGQMLLFGDRDVYRPGETLQLKAIARDWGEHGLAIPTNLTGTLHCLDARGKKFFETNAIFTELASWSQAVPLPTGSRGQFSAVLRVKDREFTHYFSVQDFQPSAFELTLKTKPTYAAGEAVEVPLSAKYYHGKKLTHAKVRWSLEAWDQEFKSDRFADFRFARWQDYRSREGSSSISLTGEGTLTDATNFVIAPTIPANPVVPQPRAVSLLAEVTDINQQTISHRAEFVRHASDFYLGVRLGAEVVTVGEEVPVEVVAVRADGQPWPQPITAQVRLQRVRWDSVRVQGAGRSVRYRNELNLSNVVEKPFDVKPLVLSTNPVGGASVSAARGKVRHSAREDARPTDDSGEEIEGTEIAGLVPSEAGEYWLEVKAKDAGGHEVITSLSFGATTPPTNAAEQISWNYRNDVQINLQPDQETYQPGQTAVLLVETPISGEALVTVEREKVLRTFRTRLEGNAPSVRVPIESGDAPNVFVSVTIVRGAADSPKKIKEPEYRVGFCQLKVESPQSHLSVAVQPAATNCLPGEALSVTATVTDAAGAPAPDAEITLWAVDEGILSLTDYAAPDPHPFFFAPRRLAVSSGVSLPNLLSEDPEHLEFRNKGYLIGGGGNERLRKNFLAVAFWHATLRTDRDGKVTAKFTAPDSLTRYRILAVAHTAKNQFGRGQSAFEVSKPLMLEPALPRFANITDRIQARAVVLNTTAQAGEVLVTLALDDKATANSGASLSRTVSISAHGSAIVEFPLTFTNTGPAKWTWRARFANDARFTDSVQSTLEVGHVAPLLTEIYLAHVNAAETNLLTRVNPQLLEGKGRVTVVVANTRLAELGEAISQLLHYPYGCAEQTSSSLLPWIVLRNSPAAKFLRRSPEEIDKAIRSGLDRLFTMQTSSGGLSYWPRGRQPMLWASAYGGMVLAVAQRQDLEVPEEEFAQLLSYLSAQLRGSASLENPRDLAERCLALYTLALAGKPESAYHEVLFQKREKLSAEDRALLALAILEAKRTVGQTPQPVPAAPTTPPPVSGTVPPPPGPTLPPPPIAHQPPEAWPKMVDELLKPTAAPAANTDEWFGCGAREIAVRLLAWTLHRPDDPIVDKLVAELMEGRRNAHWTTTQGNAWALLALTEYAARVEKKLNAAEGTLTWGAQSASFKLGESASVSEHSFALTSDLAATPLVLSNPAKGRLYTQVKIEARSQVANQPRQDRGFNLQRTYALLDDKNQPQDMKNIRVGDRVLVTLNLTVRQPAHYVAIDDALPSTLEALNPEFKSQQTSGGGVSENLFLNFRELRTDRALFFADYVDPGDYTIRYVARVRAAGEVTAPSAKIEEMYHPDRFGAAESRAVETRAME